jgi:hypothetical protein
MKYESTVLNLDQSAGFSIVVTFATFSKYVTSHQIFTLWVSANLIRKQISLGEEL